MPKISYICFYDVDKREERNVPLASKTKLDYIFSVFSDLGYDVSVYSPAWTFGKNCYCSKTRTIGENIKIHLCPTIAWKGGRAGKGLSVLIAQLWLFFTMLAKIKKHEKIIVYHSLWSMFPLYIAKLIKHFRVCLEVEELYQDVVEVNSFVAKMERKIVKNSEEYIFPTALLNEKINVKKRPYIIIHGSYQGIENTNASFGDNKIHVVYAGTLDERKGGTVAVETAAYLDANYHVHVLGFGTQAQVNAIKNKIDTVSANDNATVTYDGVLYGEEYIQFLQKCDIGLCTQNPQASFTETSFPSKILSYMSNGLRVVSIKLKSLERSSVGNYLYYYSTQEPNIIARVIQDVNLNDKYDGEKIVAQLDHDFRNKILKYF